jgi:hypothetical protein
MREIHAFTAFQKASPRSRSPNVTDKLRVRAFQRRSGKAQGDFEG